jgi:hypothetical protein
VKDKTGSWSEIQLKEMAVAVAECGKSKIAHFPVVYTTTVDQQQSVLKTTSEDGVYFIERDIFTFTSCLGILRLHTQKLGAVLQGKYPFLKDFAHMYAAESMYAMA